MIWKMVSLLLLICQEKASVCRRTQCEDLSQSVLPHISFLCSLSEWSHLNGGVPGVRIKPCFSPYSEAAVCADNGPAVEKNGALQCVVSLLLILMTAY